MFASLRSDVTNIISWFHQALDMLIVLVRGQKLEESVELIQDVRDVVSSYLSALSALLPQKPLTPMPGNFFKKLAWIASNTAWIQTVVSLTTHSNPFEAAKARAEAVAIKWQFSKSLQELAH